MGRRRRAGRGRTGPGCRRGRGVTRPQAAVHSRGSLGFRKSPAALVWEPGGTRTGRLAARGRAALGGRGRGRGRGAPRAATAGSRGRGRAMAASGITSLPALPEDGGAAFPPGHFKDPKRLYCKNGGFFLRIHPDGRVDGVREKSDPHGELPLPTRVHGLDHTAPSPPGTWDTKTRPLGTVDPGVQESSFIPESSSGIGSPHCTSPHPTPPPPLPQLQVGWSLRGHLLHPGCQDA